LDDLSSRYGCEAAILSTCNRVEVYLGRTGPEASLDTDLVAEFLAEFHHFPVDQLRPLLYRHLDAEAVHHLFRVAASLDSLIIGEGQIAKQVRRAYEMAQASSSAGPLLHALFQYANAVAGRVRTETGIGRGHVSVSSVAVDYVRQVFDQFDDKTILVIGAGKMGELTLQHLTGLKPGQILVTNRNSERAEVTAARWNGRAVPYERLEQALIDADLVISTTAAAEPIVTFEQYARVQRARRNRLSLILDIAFPRDFDPRIGELEQVMLYHIDELRAQAEENRLTRQKGIDPALAIIERETTACCLQLRHQRDVGLLLEQLGNRADQIRERELSSLYSSRPDLTEADREAIAHMAARLQNQFLHHPRVAVRSAVTEPHHDHGHPHPLLTFVRQIFGLGDRPQNSLKKT
jgi:glutamyl-tRNA reductase